MSTHGNNENFEEFLDSVPEDRRDIIQMVWSFAKELGNRDCNFAISFSMDGEDGCSISNVISGKSAGILVNSMLMDFHKRGCLPPNITKDDGAGEGWKDPE